MKTCTNCKNELPFIEFHLKNQKKMIYNSRCKNCYSIEKSNKVPNEKNIKVETCKNGHRYIPVDNKCIPCERGDKTDEVLLSFVL